jgi:hypothetical protein
MKNELLRDPTAETTPLKRARRTPPASLAGVTIGLLDIGKTRSDEFLDRIAERLTERKFVTRRYRKPTNAKTAPLELLQKIAAEAQVVVIALSD